MTRPIGLIIPGRERCIREGVCMSAPIGCGKPATAFRDELSEREFRISGLCQACQDSVFGEEACD